MLLYLEIFIGDFFVVVIIFVVFRSNGCRLSSRSSACSSTTGATPTSFWCRGRRTRGWFLRGRFLLRGAVVFVVFLGVTLTTAFALLLAAFVRSGGRFRCGFFSLNNVRLVRSVQKCLLNWNLQQNEKYMYQLNTRFLAAVLWNNNIKHFNVI